MSQSPDLKGSSFTLSVLHLSDNDVSTAVHFLKQKVDQAPTFFAAAPVVLNVSQVQGDINYRDLKLGVEEIGMIPVGVTGCVDKRNQNLATEAGFAVMTASKAPSQAPAKMEPTKIVRTPVRSGQQVYAKNSDLVILSHVSAGAEVIADGTIHIHGTLRGRAIAGASGSSDAKILCNDLQAELVSIAGHYWLSDQIERDYWGKKVLFGMTNDQLDLEILTI
ncbi:septum site-determining protein MinC [Vibrio hangzhouensis]|uniref:Probable septum site-determining protein MinC n=1 Tax=Vibrio hangzhouensis TaxID=462991 RepID=A0A1H6CEZ6_9VIBR|nr:septum site-determining protein MinC [Vibrio hangzhouensis]MBY6197626.1 septum site-determining protein MinC [Vibrio hangzhouensis]SEG71600.1 septum site-determining protein MinC [Vibrio hangzhouensis]